MDYLEAFGECSKKLSDEVLVSGRYRKQGENIPFIIEDIISKLKLSKKDILLDIGSGTGIISNALSKKVAKIFLNDHRDILEALKKKYQLLNAIFLLGNFLELNIKERFDKILAYSVIHYLKSNEEIIKFIEKAVSLLKSGGILLIGDIPNLSKKERFLNTNFGKNFSKQFSSRIKDEELSKRDKIFGSVEPTGNHIDDELLINIIKSQRDKGNETYIMPQNSECAFSYTREDLIIVKKL